MGRFAGILGMLTMLGLAYVFSTNRRAIRLKTVGWGLLLQLTFAFFVLRFELGRQIFEIAGFYVNRLLSFSFVGSEFVFGEIGKKVSAMGFSFAFQVLPTIIFIAAFFALLYHFGVMMAVVRIAAWIMTAVMGASGAESLNVAAVIMTAPGTLLMAKMLVPETEQPLTAGRVQVPEMEKEPNVLGAISRGTVDGLHLALNVGAMLITFLALLALVNSMMGWGHNHIAWFPSSLQQIFGWLFAPVAWVIGIPWHDCKVIGNLLGTRMVINELVAFQQLATLKGALDPRSFTIATFALCGFANFSSIGIQIGGIGALAPDQRGQLARLGIRAMLAGTMANLMSASIVGMLT